MSTVEQDPPRKRVLTIAEQSHRELVRGLVRTYTLGEGDSLKAMERVFAHFDIVAQARDSGAVKVIQYRDRYHATRSELTLMTEDRDRLQRENTRLSIMLAYLEKRFKRNGRQLWRLLGFGEHNDLKQAILEREPDLFRLGSHA